MILYLLPNKSYAKGQCVSISDVMIQVWTPLTSTNENLKSLVMAYLCKQKHLVQEQAFVLGVLCLADGLGTR